MVVIWIVASVACLLLITPTTEAGGRSLSVQESAQFLQLFNRICSSQTQQEGNTYYFCKTPETPTIQVSLDHETSVNPSETPKQVIFVQSPAYEYTHNVALRGGAGNPQQTEIYVLPPKATHNLALNDLRSGLTKAAKPSLYYLNENQATGNGNNRPQPVRGPNDGQQGGNLPGRPSSPPPNNPDVVGIIGGGYQAYGVPSINPRNQRNVARAAYRV